MVASVSHSIQTMASSVTVLAPGTPACTVTLPSQRLCVADSYMSVTLDKKMITEHGFKERVMDNLLSLAYTHTRLNVNFKMNRFIIRN